jgi:hypothetical protein
MWDGKVKTDCHRYLGVLGAFTQVQKEHKRHVVHIATLRAQGTFLRVLSRTTNLLVVKKIAQEKKDKLGPHWSHFVGKAVHRLVSFLPPTIIFAYSCVVRKKRGSWLPQTLQGVFPLLMLERKRKSLRTSTHYSSLTRQFDPASLLLVERSPFLHIPLCHQIRKNCFGSR